MFSELKLCTQCGIEKPRSDFFANKVCADGLQFHCKVCHKNIQRAFRERHPGRGKISDAKWRAKDPEYALRSDAKKAARWRKRHPERARVVSTSHTAKRRSSYNRALPWREEERMRIVYEKAKKYGFHVDHIVPLHHPLVSGLHVWNNLQLLEPLLNRRKNNRSWPNMPTED